ncbi:hypothetical protein AK812_SmicGene5057 [Symbiodinium microadriaticum]|uniref:Uncharacterized protein n=1 Tax=Symbiodinium microadriaticum TaxID=2951 RepID=A0A1Q9EUP6_SYMMI|nr:hypothetical protein AK812_SmicGene5057 [Symbiodinium microadriaticum]
MDLLRQGLQDICCTSRWHPTVKTRLPRRRWNDRLLPEKKARFEDVDFEVGVAGHEMPAVLESYDEEMAVLVSDLQGFPSTVRACGIVHVASIIIRKRQLCWPILTKYSAVKVTTEVVDRAWETLQYEREQAKQSEVLPDLKMSAKGAYLTFNGGAGRSANVFWESQNQQDIVLRSVGHVLMANLKVEAQRYSLLGFEQCLNLFRKALGMCEEESLVLFIDEIGELKQKADDVLRALMTEADDRGGKLVFVFAQISQQFLGHAATGSGRKVISLPLEALPIDTWKQKKDWKEADNLIVAFSAVSSAVRAALEIREVIHAYNRSLQENRQHFSIQLSGIGVHAGKGLYLSEHGDLLGEVARGAYHLGEDLCEESAILVSQSVRSKLLDEPFFAPAVFREAGEEPNSKIRYFSLEGDFDLPFDVVPADDQRYLAPSLLPLAQRHGVTGAEDLTVLDRIIGQHFKACTVLMFRGDLGQDAERPLGIELLVQNLGADIHGASS